MKIEKIMVVILLLCFMMISNVSATSDTDTLGSEVSDTQISYEDTNQIDEISNDVTINEYTNVDDKTKSSANDAIKEKDTQKLASIKANNHENILKESETKSFTDLKDSINGNITNGNYEITLKHDYKYSSGDKLAEGILIRGTDNIMEGIIIGTTKTLVIKGNGKTIDADGKARLFYVKSFANLKLENLTIINGKALSGGAIFGSNSVDITLINCTLKNNIATGTENNAGGGAIYADYSNLEIIDSTLENNNANYGGAIHTFDVCNVKITNTTLQNNNADCGGAIYMDADTLLITKSLLQNNNADDSSAIYWRNGDGNNIQFNRFIDNKNNINSVNINVHNNNKFITTPLFEITHIDDFVEGNSITINVIEKQGIKDELKVNVTIEDTSLMYPITVNNGKGKITVTPSLTPNTYRAVLTFAETGDYLATTVKSNEFQVTSKQGVNPNIQIENIPNFEVGQEIIIHVTADESFNSELNIIINKNPYHINIINGEGSTKITPNLKSGEYNATINYPGDGIYSAITVTSNKFRVRNITELLDTINQLQLKIDELINANQTLNKDVTKLQGQINELLQNNITLTQKINAQTDTINMLNAKIQTQNITQLENKLSNATSRIEILEGTIIILENSLKESITKINQLLNTNTLTTTSSSNLSPKTNKKITKISAKKKTFKSKVKVKKYTITLKAAKKVVPKAKVSITIKGKKYKKTFKTKTNKKGKAIFKIKKLSKKGKYTATIKYKGNKKYRASKKTVKITIK